MIVTLIAKVLRLGLLLAFRDRYLPLDCLLHDVLPVVDVSAPDDHDVFVIIVVAAAAAAAAFLRLPLMMMMMMVIMYHNVCTESFRVVSKERAWCLSWRRKSQSQ